MSWLEVSRFKAFSIHLLMSVCVASFAALLIFVVWYPDKLASASGVNDIFLLLIAVDVVLGPLLTLIIFNPRKKELKRDVSIIVGIQIIALIYGMFTMFSVRPTFIVFNVDRFDVVYANELSDMDWTRIEDERFDSIPWWGPQVVAAKLPDDTSAAEEIIMSAISGGSDLQHRPEYYLSYTDAAALVKEVIRPLEALKKYNKERLTEIDQLIAQYSAKTDQIGYIPLIAKSRNLSVMIDRGSTEIVEMVDIKPIDDSYGVNLIDLKEILKKNRE